MKKIATLALSLLLAINVSAQQNSGNDLLQRAKHELTERIQQAPRGTTYGVTEVTRNHIVVTSPFGRHTIEKRSDGSYTFMGMTARVISAKNGVYRVKTSLGTFTINTRRLTATKE